MIKQNITYFIPQTEEVRYLEENLTSEQQRINESYENELKDNSEVGGYGPCKNPKCNCSCDGLTSCSCRIGIDVSACDEGDYQLGNYNASAKGKISWSGAELGVKEKTAIVRTKNSFEEVRYVGTSAGAKACLDWGDGNIDVETELGIDLVSYKNKDGLKARVAINVDTGGSINDDGLKAKFLGFGVSLGKKNGISTPIGEISKTSDDCVIQ